MSYSQRVVGVSLLVVIALLGLGQLALTHAGEAHPAAVLKRADQLYADSNYAQAAELYQQLLSAPQRPEAWYRIGEQLTACYLRLQRFDDAIAAAQAQVQRAGDTPLGARANRFLGDLYLLVPKWGVRAGGKFHRAQHLQGIHVQSYRHDKQLALQYLQQARALYERFDGDAAALATLPEAERDQWRRERLDCLFDLAGAAARYGIYDNGPMFWHWYWAQRDDQLAATAGEDDFDEATNQWAYHRKRPLGLRVDDAGQPVFPTAPAAWGEDLNDDQKVLYLLAEIRELDNLDQRPYAARSWMRQALLARTRFGLDRLNAYAGMWYDGSTQPLRQELEKVNPWELGDHETLVLAGGRVMRVTLPPQWDVLDLLSRVEHPEHALEARYSMGLYHQSRQQYPRALTVYDELLTQDPQNQWVQAARTQRQRILAPEVSLAATSLQRPGAATSLQVTHRNADRLWFVARQVDVVGLMRAIQQRKPDDQRGDQSWWQLNNWHGLYVHGNGRGDEAGRLAEKHLGVEVARWSAAVEPGVEHRYATVTLPAPLRDGGAYLILASTSATPASWGTDALTKLQETTPSRAMVVLSDLALVEKQIPAGKLYYVCDSASGAPVQQVQLEAAEYWSQWNNQRRHSENFKRFYTLTSDAQGLATLKRPDHNWGSLHLLATTADGRFAFLNMQGWSHYSPSPAEQSHAAYILTDRPVYRPSQTVRFKLWLRDMQAGQWREPTTQTVRITITDPRGNTVHETNLQTDDFGGADSSFTLADEPPLGMYTLTVHGRSSQNFRVEEYRKPEFEVTVKPGATQARLGETLEAKITARYYFGAPVTHATVSYKVFRETYQPRFYPVGPWDWLYGSGYGLNWYAAPWFDWWGSHLRCWSPPMWWWGYGGAPVRELVSQGEARLDEQGEYAVQLDTAPALRDHGDQDHRYTIEAEVTDASRRVITGSGAVTVTRQSYYVFIDADRGYYRPGEDLNLTIRAVTPDGQPVAVSGLLSVSSVVFGGPGNSRIEETPLLRQKLELDEAGRASFKLRPEKSGQLKFVFAAPDRWNQAAAPQEPADEAGVVEGYALAWVVGDDFDGALHRFNELEILTDRRTYEPGDIAHVMINTAQRGSYVLLGEKVDNGCLLSHRLVHLPRGHVVLDIPVTKDNQPNFFVEATTVSAGRVHQQLQQILVPPAQGVLNVKVTYDKERYEPGETAQVTVQATTLDGKPAAAQLTLSAFDQSVLYIQPELAPMMASFFHGRTRQHHLQMMTNLFEQFSALGNQLNPQSQLWPQPDEWQGVWGPQVKDWRIFAGFIGDDLMRADEAVAYSAAGGRAMTMRGAVAAPAPRNAPMAAMEMAADATAGVAKLSDKDARLAEGGTGGDASPALVEPTVRSQFADTALWLTTLRTDADGVATTRFTMPENLTTWQLSSYAMTRATSVGQASTTAVTTKKLLVRLQTPRFFTERDEVVLSANVHNYLAHAKSVTVKLEIPDLLSALPDVPLQQVVEVPAGGEARVDFRVRVRTSGSAQVTVKALTDEASDAMQLTVPVLVHGMTRQIASSGIIRPDSTTGSATISFELPAERRPELSSLRVQFAPSLLGSMLDALPYCLDYPYGCTEQTMSRMLPAILVRRTLQDTGVKLADLKVARERLAELRRIEQGERFRYFHLDAPVFDEQEMDRIIVAGLQRITSMQNNDGGWGWWKDSDSNPYLTSYVLFALLTARQCDVPVDPQLTERGLNWLANWENEHLRAEHWRPDAGRAFSAYVLALGGREAKLDPAKDDTRPGALLERLHQRRDELNLYGKALLALTLHHRQDERAALVLQNIMQYVVVQAETQTAYFRTPQAGWWYWWNNDIETNAWILRALATIDPQSAVAPQLVKWLLNNRRNGYYWRSTRDTTLCIAALSDFARASGEADPDYTLTLNFDDGAVVKQVRINRDNFLTYDSQMLLEGVTLGTGKHTLTLTREGRGAVYFNSYLRYFSREEPIPAAGHELHVVRRYFRLRQIPFAVEVESAAGATLSENRLRYERLELKDGDHLTTGELVQVELHVTSDNDYTYLALEDFKPAGLEPVDLRSGSKWQEGFASYMELRDEKTVFFAETIGQGEHLLRYRLRAETPGIFHALPTRLFGMYAPELAANSAEQVVTVVDR